MSEPNIYTIAFPEGVQFVISVENPPTLDRLVAEYAKFILERQGGNKASAARVLGIHRRSLYRLLDDKTGK